MLTGTKIKTVQNIIGVQIKPNKGCCQYLGSTKTSSKKRRTLFTCSVSAVSQNLQYFIPIDFLTHFFNYSGKK